MAAEPGTGDSGPRPPAVPAPRDPWLQPFGPESIWNTPIGEEADLRPARLPATPQVRAELEFIYAVSPHSFTRQVYPEDADGNLLRLEPPIASLQIDDFLRFTMPLDPARPLGCGSLLMPDRRTVCSFTGLRRLHRAGDLYGRSLTRWDLFGDPAGQDGRLASGMSTFGGAIRLDGVNRLDRIDHAVKLTLPPGWLYGGGTEPRFRWPATRAPEDAETRYRGSDSQVRLGTLLTLPEAGDDAEPADRYRTAFGQAFATAVYRYGAYVVDEAPPGTIGVCMTPEAMRAIWDSSSNPSGRLTQVVATLLPEDTSADVREVLTRLSVVADNSETSVGGAGRRRVEVELPAMIDAAEYTRTAEGLPLIPNALMTEGHWTPADWVVLQPDRDAVRATRDTSVFYSPPSSLRVESVSGEPASAGRRVLNRAVRHFHVESQVRLKGPVKLTAYTQYWDGRKLRRLVLSSLERGEGIGAWQPLGYEVRVPPEAVFHRLMFEVSGPGTAWVDDVLTHLPTPETAPAADAALAADLPADVEAVREQRAAADATPSPLPTR